MNQFPPVLTKVTRPTLPDVFPRKRVFKLLDDSRKRPIIWVSGPPGCGKTTLIGSYIEFHKIPCLWYTLDEGDSDPATFFYYMGKAAKKAAPRTRKPLPLLTPEYLPGISTFTVRYFEDICSRLKSPSVVVFDNYQEVPVQAILHEIIRTGSSVISEDIKVILISRSDPPASFVRLKANRMMQTIGWNQLRFTLAETREILQLSLQKKPSRKTIEDLHMITDGWVAGLVLMIETARGQNFKPQQIKDMTLEDIFNYFANEIFDKTDDMTQKFLLQTAFLPEMTGKIAGELTGQTAAGRILTRLNRAHFFTEKRSPHRKPAYQYHPLFREFLLSKAADTMRPEKLSKLRHRAAIMLEKADNTEAAVALFRENEEWEEVARLILNQAPILLKQCRNILLEKWFAGIPQEILSDNPWLNYWMGACCFPLDPARSQSYFKRSYEDFNKRKDPNGTFMAWSGMVDAIAFEYEDLKRLDPWIEKHEAGIEEYTQLASEEIKARVALSMFFALFLRKPQHPELEKWAEKAFAVTKKELDENLKAQALFNLSYHRMMCGDMDILRSLLYDLNQLADTDAASPLTKIKAKFIATAYHQVTGSYGECLKSMKEGLKIAKKNGVHLWDVWLLGHGATAAINHGDNKTAEHLLDKMFSYFDRLKSWEKSAYHFLKAREALLQGNLEEADTHVKISLESAKKVGIFQKWNWTILLKAQVMQALQKYKEADKDLAQAFTIASQTKSNLFKFATHMLVAQFAYDRGNSTDGLISLRKGLSIGKQQKYLNCFVDQPAVTAKLCARALEAGIEVEYVQEIIQRRQLILSEPPVHLENWPWTLKIYTLGRFGLIREGKPVRFTRKAQEKPLALLKVLIAFGGREVHEEHIADALWPEAEGDLAHKSFATTLWRLRKLIGCPDAIQLSDRKLTLDPRYCWVDVWAFERIIRRAEKSWKQGLKENNMAPAISMVQIALDTYQGPFLASEANASWAISLRERLQNRFLRTVKQLCEYWQRIGQHEKAVECFQQSIEVDDLSEDFYQDLMTCYWQLGRRADALSVYERYKKTLSTKLGIEPSPEAETLREALYTNPKPIN